MRKIVFGINMTADGYCDHHLGKPDPQMVDYFTSLLQQADTLLYGKTTYELMFPYWEDVIQNNSAQNKSDQEFAKVISSVPQRALVSTTFADPDSEKVFLIRGNLENEVRKLKSQPGKNISTGGITLPSALLDLGLIDEIHLVIHPTIAGGGRRLFEGARSVDSLDLKLVDTQVFKSGLVALRYLKLDSL